MLDSTKVIRLNMMVQDMREHTGYYMTFVFVGLFVGLPIGFVLGVLFG